MDEQERFGLESNMESIRAREALDFINNVACLLAKGDEAKEYKIALARMAYEDDPETLSQVLMNVSR